MARLGDRICMPLILTSGTVFLCAGKILSPPSGLTTLYATRLYRSPSLAPFLTAKSQNICRPHGFQCQTLCKLLKLEFSPVAAHTTIMRSATTSDEDYESYDGWEAGDVETDFAKLRTAVAQLRASDYLKESERKHLLDEFAKQRRELFPDLKTFVAAPIAFGILLTFLTLSSSSSSQIKATVWSLIKGMDLCYWGGSIFAPFAMYFAKKRSMPKISAVSSELLPWDPGYQDSQKNCSDYVLCLTENWMSSAFGAALLWCYIVTSTTVFSQVPLARAFRTGTRIERLIPIGLAMSQLINRLSAAAAVHQYPKLIYELRRDNQPRPIEKFPTILNQLIVVSLLLLPLGFSCDLAKLLSTLVVSGRVTKFAGATMASTFANAAVVFIVVSLIAPMMHLTAFIRLIQIQFFTNVSLNCADYSAAKNTFLHSERSLKQLGFKWRYKLHWREPRRLSRSIKALWRDFQIFMFTGWGGDVGYSRLGSVVRGRQRFLIRPNEDRTEPEIKILSLVKEEEAKDRNAPKPDRSTWIPNATAKMAAIHQENYETKNFEDPLGIAVQQTLGIGLSFDFDHETRLKKGTSPSIHRLRARAAKSAIRRYNKINLNNEINRNEAARAYGNAREEGLTSFNASSVEEVKKNFANALLTLIPTNAPPPEGKEDLDIETLRNSDANLLPLPPDPQTLMTSQETFLDPWENAIQSQYGENHLGDPYFQTEQAFVESFLKSKRTDLSTNGSTVVLHNDSYDLNNND